MNKYNVWVDLNHFTYYVEAKDDDTARELAVKAAEEYIAKYPESISVVDVFCEEDNGIDDADIEIKEGEEWK